MGYRNAVHAYYGGAVFLITDILKIDNCIFIVLSAGFLSANITVTEMSSVFLFVEDTYLFSMFLSCLGVWLLTSESVSWLRPFIRILLSGICFFLSFGIYQASCTTALVLFVFVVIMDCMTVHKSLLRNCIKKWFAYILSLGIGAVLYAIFYKLSLQYYNTTPATSYNSISSISDLSISELFNNIKLSYMQFFSYFYQESYVGSATTYCNIALTILLAVCMIRYFIIHKVSIINWIIGAICVAILPGFSLLMGIFMGRKSIYFLTAYALYLLYPAVLAGISTWNKKIRCFTIALSVIIILQNIFYSNGAYTVQKILYDRALSNVTRILDDIEAEKEYVIGETSVIIIGTLSGDTGYLDTLTSDYSEISGFYRSSVTYNQTFSSMAHLLGTTVKRETDDDVITYYSNLEVIQEMPTYPKDGYYKMLDGYMIIKLSE